MNEFHAGCESYEQSNLDEVERAFRAVLAQMPDHLDVFHHLALVLSKRDLGDQALDRKAKNEAVEKFGLAKG